MSIYVQIDDLSEHGFGKNPSLGSRTEVELPGKAIMNLIIQQK